MMINTIEEFSRWAQLSFNPMKCASLSMINGLRKKYVERRPTSGGAGGLHIHINIEIYKR